MTQQKLAELADLNVRTIQKIEAGRITILITTAMRLQRALGCDWDKVESSPPGIPHTPRMEHRLALPPRPGPPWGAWRSMSHNICYVYSLTLSFPLDLSRSERLSCPP